MKYITIRLSGALLLLAGIFLTGCASKRNTLYHKAGHTSASRQKSTMRSYEVHGKRYRPTYVEVGERMRGISSWYGPNFRGKFTSSGERYNMHARTAAHKTWPMDTMVKVTNLQNGKSTTVRINDRGPFVRGRIIDCSYAAGKAIGLDRMGIAKVEIEVVGFAGKIATHNGGSHASRDNSKRRIRLTNFGVQVGAFRNYEGANRYRREYADIHPKYKPYIKKFPDVNGAPLYRVWLMGFNSEAEARDFKNTYNMPGAFIVRN